MKNQKWDVEFFKWLRSIRLSSVTNGHIFDDDANRIIDYVKENVIEELITALEDLLLAQEMAFKPEFINTYARARLTTARENAKNVLGKNER